MDRLTECLAAAAAAVASLEALVEHSPLSALERDAAILEKRAEAGTSPVPGNTVRRGEH